MPRTKNQNSNDRALSNSVWQSVHAHSPYEESKNPATRSTSGSDHEPQARNPQSFSPTHNAYATTKHMQNDPHAAINHFRHCGWQLPQVDHIGKLLKKHRDFLARVQHEGELLLQELSKAINLSVFNQKAGETELYKFTHNDLNFFKQQMSAV